MNPDIEAMRDAMSDELFSADLREVMEDFRYTDGETLAAYLARPLGED